ncbi:MFS general substrate transporter [Gloeophyllum trabeum ATCC 11539]|uniref:MFS general substrate transporter n=1 Tax=Gloeophyllum trabeum (strain ATCC 11539 / FP-39264 / Madison 617) TaxID=670483 RepID=S7PRQ9_GLOTA|nr:MFS general substrate transporter [Gloeophyllum trabeum ATCC 11539]EPQ50062.1 MFS general substrate transporter [Gloeophyllum trabeum ATCC 11539]
MPDPTVTKTVRTRDLGFLPIPPHCRHRPDEVFQLRIWQTAVFALASTFSMNLYYVQPILVQLSNEFDVSYVKVSRIPSLLQAGYAIGLVFLSPLGDLIHRRQFIFFLMTAAAGLTIGLAITKSLVAFEVLSFFVAVVSITPQVLIPLTAELAPPHRRASSIAVVMSGLLMGVMLARVLSGIITQFSSYHNIYWMGVGGQFLLLIVMYLICPDTPPKNPDLTYFRILGTMARFAVTEPLLIQTGLILFADSAIYAGFWVTMTFLLSGAPYNYSTLDIGLFGLVGIFGIMTAPFVGRLIDGLIPWAAGLLFIGLILISMAIQTAAGGINVGAVVVAIFVLDVGVQGLQVALTTNVFSINPDARARLNAVVILCGQVMGTSVSTRLFVEGGYRAVGYFALGLAGLDLVLLFLRGPHLPNNRWVGWAGGFGMRKVRPGEVTVKEAVEEVVDHMAEEGQDGGGGGRRDVEKA